MSGTVELLNKVMDAGMHIASLKEAEELSRRLGNEEICNAIDCRYGAGTSALLRERVRDKITGRKSG